jgi:hypothetical protein
VSDPRARRGLPDRWLLPPAPRDPGLAARWEAMPFDRRRELARLGPDELQSLPSDEAELVRGLARARLSTRWRPLAAAAVLGWLVVMTVWGFGRTAAPDAHGGWLLAGLVLGSGAGSVAARAGVRRLRRARAIEARG